MTCYILNKNFLDNAWIACGGTTKIPPSPPPRGTDPDALSTTCRVDRLRERKAGSCFSPWRQGGGVRFLIDLMIGAIVSPPFCTDKKRTKFYSYIRKFRWDRLQSHIWRRELPNIWAFMRKCANINQIWGVRQSYMTLQPIPSEFPYIWGKFSFLFYQCAVKKCRAQLLGRPSTVRFTLTK